jgi:hypothetical protein
MPVIPVEAGIQGFPKRESGAPRRFLWIPAYAGME